MNTFSFFFLSKLTLRHKGMTTGLPRAMCHSRFRLKTIETLKNIRMKTPWKGVALLSLLEVQCQSIIVDLMSIKGQTFTVRIHNYREGIRQIIKSQVFKIKDIAI